MRVTLKDLAEETGFSITTVSRALGGHDDVSLGTRQLILAAANRLGYQPNVLARQLQSQRTNTIGLILPTYGPRFADAFFSEFLSGVGTEATAQAYDLLLAAADAEQIALGTYQRMVGGGRVDGVIVLRTQQHDPRIQYLHDTNTPFVAFGRSETDFSFSYVDIDDQSGLQQITQHFIDLGHRRIGFVSAQSNLMFTKYRLAGYRAALESNGLAYAPDLVAYGDLTQDSGFERAMDLFQLQSQPTAIIAANDLLALGVLKAARQIGLRVGDTLAVGSYDDTPLAAHADPPLTSVNSRVFESGQQVCQMLVRIIKGDASVGEHMLLEPELVVRESSGQPRTSA